MGATMPSPFLRHALDLAILIPGAVFALSPAWAASERSDGRARLSRASALCGALASASVIVGAWLCASHGVASARVLLASTALLLLAYCLTVDMSPGRKLFCAADSAMLCSFCALYAQVLMASVELGNEAGPIDLRTGAIALGLSVLLGAIFIRTLMVELPMLLRLEPLGHIWRLLLWAPLGATALMIWAMPRWPSVVLTGRIRPVSLVFLWLVPVAFLSVWHLIWRIAVALDEGARLQRENTLLMMEHKRYQELRNYMDATRAMRHDLRQHLLVIERLAGLSRLAELRGYIHQLIETQEGGWTPRCANGAVDAIAAHYDAMAREQGTEIVWDIDLPATLPLRDMDYCAILGDLLENALRAVSSLPPERRRVDVISSALSDEMIGLSVDQPFDGEVSFGPDGLPRSTRPGGGVGLASVASTVRRYGGSMEIRTEGGVFSVAILLYAQDSSARDEAHAPPRSEPNG